MKEINGLKSSTRFQTPRRSTRWVMAGDWFSVESWVVKATKFLFHHTTNKSWKDKKSWASSTRTKD